MGAGTEQVLLTGDLVEGARPHPGREWGVRVDHTVR